MKAFEKHLVQTCPSCQRFMYAPPSGATHLVWICDDCAARLEQPKTKDAAKATEQAKDFYQEQAQTFWYLQNPQSCGHLPCSLVQCASLIGLGPQCPSVCKEGCMYAKQSISSKYYFSERVKPKGWVIVVDGQCLQTIYKTAEDARAAAEYSIQSKFSCGGNGIHSIAQIGAL